MAHFILNGDVMILPPLSGTFHAGSTSGSPLLATEDESDLFHSDDFDYCSRHLFEDSTQTGQGNSLSHQVATVNTESPEVPGMPSQTKFDQFHQVIASSAVSLRSDSKPQFGSFLLCEEDLSIPMPSEVQEVKQEIQRSITFQLQRKRKSESIVEKEFDQPIQKVSRNQVAYRPETGFRLTAKTRKEIETEFKMLANAERGGNEAYSLQKELAELLGYVIILRHLSYPIRSIRIILQIKRGVIIERF